MMNAIRLYLLTTIPHHFCFVALVDLALQTIATNATHNSCRTELEMHHLSGHLMSRADNLAVRKPTPRGASVSKLSFDTFADSGRQTVR